MSRFLFIALLGLLPLAAARAADERLSCLESIPGAVFTVRGSPWLFEGAYLAERSCRSCASQTRKPEAACLYDELELGARRYAELLSGPVGRALVGSAIAEAAPPTPEQRAYRATADEVDARHAQLLRACPGLAAPLALAGGYHDWLVMKGCAVVFFCESSKSPACAASVDALLLQLEIPALGQYLTASAIRALEANIVFDDDVIVAKRPCANKAGPKAISPQVEQLAKDATRLATDVPYAEPSGHPLIDGAAAAAQRLVDKMPLPEGFGEVIDGGGGVHAPEWIADPNERVRKMITAGQGEARVERGLVDNYFSELRHGLETGWSAPDTGSVFDQRPATAEIRITQRKAESAVSVSIVTPSGDVAMDRALVEDIRSGRIALPLPTDTAFGGKDRVDSVWLFERTTTMSSPFSALTFDPAAIFIKELRPDPKSYIPFHRNVSRRVTLKAVE